MFHYLFKCEGFGFTLWNPHKSTKSKVNLITRQLVNSVLYGVNDDQNPRFRPIVPSILQPAIFHIFHGTLHQGKKKSFELIRRHYFWSTMRQDIERWVQYCPKCQCCKVTKHNRQSLENFPDNPKRLSVVHVDVVGPLNPEVQEYKYLLTMRDRNTGFIRMIPLMNKTSSTIVNEFYNHWISIFGTPEKVITDNGREFVSETFENLCRKMGVVHTRTTPYHPQSNGLIERIHRMVKTALRALDDKEEWLNQIPLITLMLNNQTSDTNSYTPYQKTFGSILTNAPNV